MSGATLNGAIARVERGCRLRSRRARALICDNT